MKCAASGCGGAPATLASGFVGGIGIAVDATSVYWTTGAYGTYGTVMKCALEGCGGSPTTVVSGSALASEVVVDSTSIYWLASTSYSPHSDDDTVMKFTPK
jgi:hypothetical protein